MILVDTSIWVDHLRADDPTLAQLLTDGQVLVHPAVAGEIALGHLVNRDEILGLLANLPQVEPATDVEVLALINSRRLFGRGIGYVGAHLLGAALLTPSARLWSRDRRLHATAVLLGCAAEPRPTRSGRSES